MLFRPCAMRGLYAIGFWVHNERESMLGQVFYMVVRRSELRVSVEYVLRGCRHGVSEAHHLVYDSNRYVIHGIRWP